MKNADLQFPTTARQRVQSLAPARGDSWYRIQNATKDEATIYVYDVIAWFGVSADQFVRDLDKITAKTIHLHVNSPGGDVFEGITIYNGLKNHKAHVVTHVDGIAASIASIIALAGDEVIMSEGAFMMVHNPWWLVIGEASDLRDAADILDKIGDSLAGIYAKASGRSVREMMDMMAEETWLNADDAVEAGFADSVEESDEEPQDAFDLSVFAHAPAELACRPAAAAKSRKPTERDAEKALRDAGFSRAAARSIVDRGYKAPEPRDEDGDDGELNPRDEDSALEWMDAAQGLLSTVSDHCLAASAERLAAAMQP